MIFTIPSPGNLTDEENTIVHPFQFWPFWKFFLVGLAMIFAIALLYTIIRVITYYAKRRWQARKQAAAGAKDEMEGINGIEFRDMESQERGQERGENEMHSVDLERPARMYDPLK
jgi:hypothetical protein